MSLEERFKKFEEFSCDSAPDPTTKDPVVFHQDLKDYLAYLKSEEDTEKSRLGENYNPNPF